MGKFSLFSRSQRASIAPENANGRCNDLIIAGTSNSGLSSGSRRRKSTIFDPDDKWSNLYREREKNSLYKWVGVRTGKFSF